MARASTSAAAPIQQQPATKLAVFIRAKDRIPSGEGIIRATGGGMVVASNKRIDQAFESGEWRDIPEAFPCGTGTMAAYVEPNTYFRDSKHVHHIGSKRYLLFTDPDTKQRTLFPIPYMYLDLVNRLLLVEHPNYILVPDGKDRVVEPKSENDIVLISDFPTRKNGWFLADAEHGIPQGSETSRNNANARYLHRMDSRVGPARRGYVYYGLGDYYGRRDVYLDDWPSDGFGVVVETMLGTEMEEDRQPKGKLVLLPSAQIAQPKIISPYEAIQQELVNQALKDLFRPYDPKYPRY